jgi:hypothetical protein
MVRADHCIPHQSRYYWKLEIVNLPDDGYVPVEEGLMCIHSSATDSYRWEYVVIAQITTATLVGPDL